MRKMIQATFLIGICLLLAFLFIPGDPAVGAQEQRAQAPQEATETIRGEWTAETYDKDPDKIQLNMRYRTAGGGNHANGSSYLYSDLQGLSPNQVRQTDAPAVFQISREAGTILFEGTFREGRGAGFFTFTPNQKFVAALAGRGFQNIPVRRLLSAVNVDLTIGFVDDLQTVSFETPLTLKDLIKARIFNVTSGFANELRAAGLGNLTIKELVKARIFKVDSGFAAQLRAMGFDNPTMRDLTKLRIHKVTPAYIEEIRAEGLTNLTMRDLTKMRIHGVDGNFIREIRAEGYQPDSVGDLVKLRIHGVDGEFIRRAKADGYTNLSLRDLVKLKLHGRVK